MLSSKSLTWEQRAFMGCFRLVGFWWLCISKKRPNASWKPLSYQHGAKVRFGQDSPSLHLQPQRLDHCVSWGPPLCCRVSSSIPGLYPLDARCTAPQSRQLKLSPFIVTCEYHWIWLLCSRASPVYSWDPPTWRRRGSCVQYSKLIHGQSRGAEVRRKSKR